MSAQLRPFLLIGQLRKAAAAASEGEPPRDSSSVARDVPSLRFCLVCCRRHGPVSDGPQAPGELSEGQC